MSWTIYKISWLMNHDAMTEENITNRINELHAHAG